MAPIANLTVRVSAQIAEFQKSFADTSRTINKFADEFEGVATRAAAVGSFLGNIAADIAGSLARGFGGAIKEAIKFSSEFQNAFLGLSSVARAFGTDANLARDAARKLSADGLIPLRDSATGLKNLLATGFSLPQATQLMNAFKDSAAFGRAGALAFGEAVRTATEGVKNGNSILVDNAGITKNLSQILKEAGFSAQDLSRASSDAGVRMALFNGILKESRAFTGDAARLTQTYTGTIESLNTSYHNLLATWGDAVTQNATVAKALGFVRDQFQSLNKFLSDNQRGFRFVAEAVIDFVKVIDVAVRAVNAMQGVFNALDSVLVGVSRGILQSVKVIADSLLDLVKIAAVVPGGSFAIAGLAKEIGSLQFISEKSGKAIDAFAERIADNDRRTVRWNSALSGVSGELKKLIGDLEESRGKTIALGESSDRAGSSLQNGLAAGAAKVATALKGVKDSIKQTILTIGELNKIGIRLQIPDPIPTGPGVREGLAGLTRLPGIQLPIPPALSVVNPFREAFGQLGRDLPGIIFGTLQHGGSMFGAIASSFAAQFANTFQAAVAKVKANLSKGIADALTSSQKAIGTLGVGLAALVAGFGIGASTNKTKGTLGGAAAGAVAGLPLAGATGGASIIIGAGIGALGGFFGGRAADKKNQAALREQQAQVLAMFGGFDALKRKADELGVSIGNAFTTKKPAEFQAAMERLNTAIENQKKRWEGLQTAVAGVNTKAELFAAPFRALADARKESGADLTAIAAKMAETAQRGQAEFERLGTFVAATFAGMVKESGDAIGAISALSPAFKVLKDGVSEFGLTSTGTINELLGMFNLVNDAVTGPILQNIAATGQIFAGLQQGGVLTSSLFQTVATDIGASFRELEAKGGDVAKAMALSQPVLQKLWEAQQTYGAVTDETTAKLLKQAEEQGLVGDRMRDVNQKILDVLIAIADVFGAKIPEGFRRTTTAAREAASGIESAFRDIRIAPIKVDVDADVRWNLGDFEQPRFEVPALAGGGVVRRPTLALIGESGPEAVMPLSQLSEGGSSSVTPKPSQTINLTIQALDGVSVKRVWDSQIVPMLNAGGETQTKTQQALRIKV